MKIFMKVKRKGKEMWWEKWGKKCILISFSCLFETCCCISRELNGIEQVSL